MLLNSVFLEIVVLSLLMKACASVVFVSHVPNVKKETVWMLGQFIWYTEALNVFNSCTDWFVFALSCWRVALCALCFSVWVQWGDCKTAYKDGRVFVFGRTFFLHLCGWNSLYIKVRKTTKGQKTHCIQLVSATQYMCVQLYKAKRFQLFQKPFEEVILMNAGRYSRSPVLNLWVRTPADNLSCNV